LRTAGLSCANFARREGRSQAIAEKANAAMFYTGGLGNDTQVLNEMVANDYQGLELC